MKSIDINTLLPVGEKLKPLLTKSVITEADMKNLIRKRGVFLGGNDRRILIPYLTMSLLSPKEFEELQEFQKSKEDNIKFRNSKLTTFSKTNLVDVLETDLISTDEIDVDIIGCNFHTDLDFKVKNSDELYIEYEILRDDLTKDWANSESKFNGRIEVKKDIDNGIINILSEFTSPETEDINMQIIKKITKELNDKAEINDVNDVFEITSNSLNNKERFKYLLSMAHNSPNGVLEFKAVRNIEIGPDKESKVVDISFMDNSVRNIIINSEKGETLEKIDYVSDEKYHELLILRALQVEYKFNLGKAFGTCILEFGFPHFFRSYKKSKVFEATINKIWFNRGSQGENTVTATRKILNEFNAFSQLEYEKIKSIEKGKSNDMIS